MKSDLPRYSNPPVVETVLSVQFAPLNGYSSAFAGRFWGLSLGKDWTKSTEAPRIDDQFERFDSQSMWMQGVMRVSTGGQPQRVQITSANEDRMIQIQDSRFILNWRKQPGQTYPTYPALSAEFLAQFRKFAEFARDAGLGNIEPNGWELTYVNHIPKGEMWNSPEEFSKIVPGLRAVATPDCTLETMNADWRYTLANERGRIYASIRHVKILSTGSDAMMIQLVTRGPVSLENQHSLEDGLDLGHAATARFFTALTSAEAQAHWGREA